jgi:hypothetical protein
MNGFVQKIGQYDSLGIPTINQPEVFILEQSISIIEQESLSWQPATQFF